MAPAGAAFAGALTVAVGLTISSLMLRALRWIFLLRRSVRIPIRDAYIGYLSGLSLLLTPLLVGEIAVRALVVLGTRVATVGAAIVLGVEFAIVHARASTPARTGHLDAIADAYDVHIPESRRRALVEAKTSRMIAALSRHGLPGRKGLDLGCGQGAYVARMRESGFDVDGIDDSPQQIRLAARNVGANQIVTAGSALRIPAPDAVYNFVYAINVLHHLKSVDEQRQAVAEMLRVMKLGGLLFVHVINTRNILFRFYMGYVFPSVNCIDEGVERWLLPHRLVLYIEQPIVEVQYFTFLPDFVPQRLVRVIRPLERLPA